MTEMTAKALLKLCRDHSLYSTPELNDKLYLHYKGWSSIANLEPYTDLKVLYLEGNAFTSPLTGLAHLSASLRCLYLQENCLSDLSGVEQLRELDTLNVSQNRISEVGVEMKEMKKLNTLLLAQNKISTTEALLPLLDCPSLSVLDLSRNNLSDPSLLPSLLARLPNLKVLYLRDNPALLASIPNYRKAVISACASLTYLDDRPVFAEERRSVEAWRRGGIEEERKEMERMRKEKEDREERNYLQFEEMMAMARKEKGKEVEEEEQKEEEETARAGEEKKNSDSDSESEQDQETEKRVFVTKSADAVTAATPTKPAVVPTAASSSSSSSASSAAPAPSRALIEEVPELEEIDISNAQTVKAQSDVLSGGAGAAWNAKSGPNTLFNVATSNSSSGNGSQKHREAVEMKRKMLIEEVDDEEVAAVSTAVAAKATISAPTIQSSNLISELD